MLGREVWVIDAVRTPIGRFGGALASYRPDDLAAMVIRAVLDRKRVALDVVDDVYFGAANQAGEDNRNVARMGALLAGLPVEVPGVTLNRLCGSSLQAINSGAHAIASGEADVIVAGGVESMTRAPYVLPKSDKPFGRGAQLFDTVLGWRMVNPHMKQEWTISLGETAERVAAQYGLGREEQDRFALGSQQRAKAAMDAKRFASELIAVDDVTTDEHPRGDTTLESLAKLKPAFLTDGTVTAGNSSGINDGAAALLLASAEAAQRLGLAPMAKIISTAAAGVSPEVMGLGPIPASRKALERAKIGAADLDLIEVNEAFASQALACLRDLEFDPEKTNVNGGAIALGHPLGASGARIATTLLHELVRRQQRFGLATMCIGVGQGVATIFERME